MEGTHGEYNDANNLFRTQIEHAALFAAPYKISVPMGNTVRIPVSVRYTTGENEPRILVSEFSGQEEPHMSVLSFRDGSFANGAGSGTVVLAPSGEGSGFVRLLDANTNSFFDIAYTVTPPAQGVNIFNDNELFSFHNTDGSDWDGAAAASTQSWQFDGIVPVWGADNTEPYLANLAKGKPGSSFTFTTQAESITLVFDGSARVESDFEGFRPVEISASGGSGDDGNEYATVVFGDNPENLSHTVTVTVTGTAGGSGTAAFDRLIETFSEEGGVPVPDPNVYAREDAKAELAAYKNAEDYRDAQKAELADAIAAGNAAIDAAADADAIAEALADTKAALDAIKTDAELTAEEALADAKTAAKEELASYKNADDYRDAQKAELADAIGAGNAAIDAAADADAIAAALADAKAALDAIKTDAQLTAEELAAFEEYRASQISLAEALRREGDSQAVAALIDEAVAALTGFVYDEAKTLAENEDALSEVLTMYAKKIAAKRQAERQEADGDRRPCSLCGKHHTGGIVDNFIGIIHGIIWIMRSILLIAA